MLKLKEKEYARLRKELKEKHEKEVKKFDERKSSVKSKNDNALKNPDNFLAEFISTSKSA